MTDNTFYIFANLPGRKKPSLLGKYKASWPIPAMRHATEAAEEQGVEIGPTWYVEDNAAFDALLDPDEKAAIEIGAVLTV